MMENREILYICHQLHFNNLATEYLTKIVVNLFTDLSNKKAQLEWLIKIGYWYL